MPRLVRPSAITSSTSRSRGVSSSSAPRRPRIIVATTSGSSTDPPRATRATRGDEALDLGDAVLEQVADALGAVGQQLARVALLEMGGEHEHADVRGSSARMMRRRLQALVGVVGRHADVDHRDVGAVRADLAQQVVAVAGLGDDVEAGVLEQPDHAGAQQHVVLADDDPQRLATPRLAPELAGLELRDGRVHAAEATAGRAGAKPAGSAGFSRPGSSARDLMPSFL